MIKTLLSVAPVLLVTVQLIAQKAPVKFGDVPLEDVKMTSYEKDTSAVALVLMDYGVSKIEYQQVLGFVLEFDRTTRIKILKKEGFDWANFEIPVYIEDRGSQERASGIKVQTHNLVNGKVETTKIKNDDIFRESLNKNNDVLKISAPNVKEGSVVEITYTISSEFLFNFQDWTFQSTIPVLWSEYRASIPEFFHYNRYMQGYISLHINEETRAGKDIILNIKDRQQQGYNTSTSVSQERVPYMEDQFRWAAKDVPAFHAEPYLTTYKDYLSKINFELAYTKFPDQPIKPILGSWMDISKKLWSIEEFGGEVKGNGFLGKIVESVVSPSDTPEEKASKLSAYVKANVNWDGHSQMFSSGSLKRVLDEKKGSSADINLLLTSMLQKAGLAAYPVLLSTRDHGFVRESIAILQQFNYVICMVKAGDKVYLLDATQKFLPTGVLPENCLNGRGFVIDGVNEGWVNLTNGSKSRTVVETTFKLDPNGGLHGDLSINNQGYPAYRKREGYLANGEEKHVEKLCDGKTWNVSEKKFENVKDLSAPFKESYTIAVEDLITDAGGVLYIDPIFLLRETENPFKLEKREYPVDFGSPFEKVFLFKLQIPEGYEVDEVPAPKVIMLPENAARYTYNTQVIGNTLNITSMLSVNKAIFSQLEYPNLKEFYSVVVAKQSEQIVLKKR